MLCILTSFWVLQAPESWSKYFFWAMYKLFFHFKPFLWFHAWNQTRRLKRAQKSIFDQLSGDSKQPKASQNTQHTHGISLLISQTSSWFTLSFGSLVKAKLAIALKKGNQSLLAHSYCTQRVLLGKDLVWAIALIF